MRQATARNAAAVESGRIELRLGSVEAMPFEDNTFDKALAINSMQVWPDAVAGLREIWRVLKPHGSAYLTHPAGVRNICGPPVMRNRQTSSPAIARKAILSQVV